MKHSASFLLIVALLCLGRPLLGGMTPQEFAANEERIKREREERERAIIASLKEREDSIASFREPEYRAAVEKAARGRLGVLPLSAITKSNPNLIWNQQDDRILMTSWIPEVPYKQYYEPQLTSLSRQLTTAPVFAYMSWVTAVPEVKNFIANYIKAGTKSPIQIQERVAQLLGLPRPLKSEKRYFVEMWIRPEDLARPCGTKVREQQPELRCELLDLQPEKTLTGVPLSPQQRSQLGYEKWFEEKGTYEYWKSTHAYPWTRLGYTFDWGPGAQAKDNRGVDEFIIKPGSRVILQSATPTEQYGQLPTPASGTVTT